MRPTDDEIRRVRDHLLERYEADLTDGHQHTNVHAGIAAAFEWILTGNPASQEVEAALVRLKIEVRRGPCCPTCVCGKRAPVQGDSFLAHRRDEARAQLGREPRGPGTISWEEHEKAWSDYARIYGQQQSAQRLAERGGFGYGELIQHLGRDPTTWRPAGRGDLWNKAEDA